MTCFFRTFVQIGLKSDYDYSEIAISLLALISPDDYSPYAAAVEEFEKNGIISEEVSRLVVTEMFRNL